MNDFNKPKENTPYNNENDEWSELTDMANGYNKSAATANKEYPGLTQRIMENLKKHPKAAKVLETLAISAMLTVAGL